jgi:amino acid transporter
MQSLRRILLGRRLSSQETPHTKISNPVGLAVFSSDALSSVAYATQEIMASLSGALLPVAGVGVIAGVAGHGILGWSIPVALGIVALLVILAISYRQTILAYPGGGGAYIVAKENLGDLPALTAGASLLIDYLLTVAVSVSSGVAAITAAVPALAGHNVFLTILAIGFIALMNLRGIRESGIVFAIPTYGFVVSILLVLGYGLVQILLGWGPALPEAQQAAEQSVQLAGLSMVWVFMRAYSAGCTALTGVEAISNGSTAFREPAGPNAAKTMVWMVLLLGTMFLGITFLAHRFGVTYQHSADPSMVAETLLSKLNKAILGDVSQGLPKLIYYGVQGFTFAILVVAANTAFADFPRLAALQARDGFLPRQFASQGDRLVFSNGILLLFFFSALLVWLFHANTDVLLPLYAAGVFIGFTLSQSGMVVHWRKVRGRHWHLKAFVNGLGAVTALIVLLDIAITKFIHGAWIVLLLVPLLVVLHLGIRRHYVGVRSRLAASRTDAVLLPKHHALVLVNSIHGGVVQALLYARLISGDRVEAITVDLGSDGGRDSSAIERLREDWTSYGMGIPLRVLPSPYRRMVEPILEEVERLLKAEPELALTVVLPEFITSHWWQQFLHNQSALRIKAALLLRTGVIVTSVPVHLP